ncbi:MAG: response regulator transcription factor, partial [Cellulosilyticaceae bacterium]
KAQPQLVLLDINLPVFDGNYICKEVRRISDVPIIIVTSRNSDMDELLSMNFGADDFITKPYNTEILLARISAILKRSYGKVEVASRLEYKGLQLSLANGSVSYSDKSLELTKNELKILAQLMKSQGNIVSREELMEVLWQSELFIDDNTLSVNVTRLRKKLEDLGMKDVIETRRGLGYIMP